MNKKSKENNFPALITFRTTEEQKDYIKKLADEEMILPADVMRRMIRDYMRNSK